MTDKKDRRPLPAPIPYHAVGDITDPFRNDERNGIILPFQKSGPVLVDWAAHINPQEREILLELGGRCSRLIQQLSTKHPPGTVIPPHPMHCAADIALVHIRRKFNLLRCLELDDLILTSQYARIAQHIDRVQCRFPDDVSLNLPLQSRLIFNMIRQRFKF